MRLEGWHGWVGTFTGVVLLTVATLPLAALATWALARRRGLAGARSARAWRMSLAEVGIVYGTVPPVWLILLPGDEDGAVVNLVPLRDLLTMDTGQIAGNLLVFAALGSSPRCGSWRWHRYGEFSRSGRAGRSWSRQRSTSSNWTGCRRWTTYCSTQPAPIWPHWRHAAGGADDSALVGAWHEGVRFAFPSSAAQATSSRPAAQA